MKRKLHWPFIVFSIALLLTAGVRSSSPAITSRYHDIIRIAYMNGYVSAVRQDIDTIRKLQNDSTLLKETVMTHAAVYLDRVSQLNAD